MILSTSDPQTFSITVTPVNDPPKIIGQNVLSTSEETPLTIGLADLQVTDPDNAYPGDFTLTVGEGADYSLSGNTITPVKDYHGTLTVPASVHDGTDSSANYNLMVTVNPVNDPPAAENDSYSTEQNKALTGPAPGVLANDSDPEGNTLTAVLASPTANGTITLHANGSFLYTPGTDFTGEDSFKYYANDGTLNSTVATVSITVFEGTCPDCSGVSREVKGVRFRKGMKCSCNCTEELSVTGVTVEDGAEVTFDCDRKLNIGPDVTIEDGAKATFRGASVNIKAYVKAARGAEVTIRQK